MMPTPTLSDIWNVLSVMGHANVAKNDKPFTVGWKLITLRKYQLIARSPQISHIFRFLDKARLISQAVEPGLGVDA